MFQGHFYHATIRRIVAVFGTLFNNISVVRKDSTGKVVNITRVPLAYGPKQKFLARLDEQKDLNDAKVAIKLPRMSFEIISMTYDATIKTNRNNMLTADDTDSTKKVFRNYAPYRIGFQLSIMAKNQDDALQCLEQILPSFQPEYTVTIKDLDELNIKTDVPFVLTGVTMTDDYEGDFLQRRAIVYTLDFETRIRFYGPVSTRGIIKNIQASLGNGGLAEKINVTIDPPTAGPNDSYNVVTSINFVNSSDRFNLTMAAGSGTYTVGETIEDTDNGTTAKVVAFANNILTVSFADGIFTIGDTVVGLTSNCSRTITAVQEIFTPSPIDP